MVPPWFTIALLSLSGTVASVQATLVVPLMPQFPHIFGAPEDDASWLLTATLLTAVVSMPITSRLADMLGKRRMLLVSMGLLALGSVLCALSSTLSLMIIGRALQGMSAALIPVGISIMRDVLPPERLTSAVSLMSATVGIGAALGLPLSGILNGLWGWRSIFWTAALITTLAMVGLALCVRESPVRSPGSFDALGALLLTLALICFLLPVSKGASWGWHSYRVWALGFASLLAFVMWFAWERRARQPIVDLDTAARRPVLVTNTTSFFIGFALFANVILTTRILQLPTSHPWGIGLDPARAGWALVPTGLALVVTAPLAARLIEGLGPKPVLMLSALVIAVAYLARIFAPATLITVSAGAVVVAVGTGLAFASAPTIVMSAVPITETASANGLNHLHRNLGTTTSSAVVALVITQTETVVPGVPEVTVTGLRICFLLSGLAALLALALASLLRRGTNGDGHADQGVPVAGAAEFVVSGRIEGMDEVAPPRAAVVAAMDFRGRQVDWSRTDAQGQFSIVVPNPGTVRARRGRPGPRRVRAAAGTGARHRGPVPRPGH